MLILISEMTAVIATVAKIFKARLRAVDATVAPKVLCLLFYKSFEFLI